MSDKKTASRSTEQARRITVEHDGEIVILIPDGDLGEFAVSEITDESGTTLFELHGESGWRHLIIDFRKTDYFGSSALGLFIRLWKRVQQHGGKMAVCNLSEHEKDLLKITRLTEFWSVCSDLDEAAALVRAD